MSFATSRVAALAALAAAAAVMMAAAPAQAAAYPFGLYDASNNLQYSFPKTPAYAIEYLGWSASGTQSFPDANVAAAHAAGTTPLLEMQTCGNPCDLAHAFSLDTLIAGGYDTSLITFANAINTRGVAVWMTFDHEMNGSWYPWDATDGGTSTGVTPTKWKNAWNHVRNLIDAHTALAFWIWAPNIEQGGTAVSAFWPGSSGTGRCGLDGYYANTGTTWSNRFAASVTDLKAVCGTKKWSVTETGIPAADSNAVAQIDDLIAGAKGAGAETLFYFNKTGSTWRMTTAMQNEFVTDVS